MKHRTIKALPEYLQPKILSAVAFINSASPNIIKATERINRLSKHLSDKEMMYVMSLLVFDKLLIWLKIVTSLEIILNHSENNEEERTLEIKSKDSIDL